jgi:hypothetical protein
MFAGHHTSSGTSSWTLIELMRHAKVYAEVTAELDDLYADGQEVSFHALRQIPKLENVIKETLRLHPPLIILMRVAQDEFEVQTDSSSGPSLTLSFEGKNVLDVLKDIRSATFQKNVEDENDLRVYFDMLPVNLAGSAPLGWLFVTRAGLYGTDLTAGLPFSLENENIKTPSYSISHLEEINTVYAQGGGRGATQIIQRVDDAARQNSSRWNRCESVISASNETTTTGLQDRGMGELNKNRPKTELPLVFLSTPGTAQSPRSLYGVDWNLGDRVMVQYADLEFEAEIKLVYINVDEQGKDEVSGRNEVNSA